MNKTFLKWAGNKSKLMPNILSYINPNSAIIDPFMGSASLMLNCKNPIYIGNDLNSDLTNLYKLIQLDIGSFLDNYLRPLFSEDFFNSKEPTEKHKNAGEATYYFARDLFNSTTDINLKSALFVFLNKHCFNGLCRYGKNGKFNTPFNFGKLCSLPEKEILCFSELSKKAKFTNTNFADSFLYAEKGDTIYCDPPYLPQDGKSSTFTEYAKKTGFGINEHILLVELAKEYRTKNITVIISNHNSEYSRELYSGADKIEELQVHRSMGRYSHKEKSAKELLAIYMPK